MTHWFNPLLLAKLLLNVVVSGIFGQYADRRLMIAALDTVPPEEQLELAKAGMLPRDSDGAAWLDFAADLGDGFDSTFAIASLLAADKLVLDGTELPRGGTLILGGDEVYPTASANAYRYQLGTPFALALPDPDRRSEDGIPIYAIPGNHDWYDGLMMFIAFFCRKKSWHIGAWRTRQRRSYFALQLTDQWWLWCMDIQLADDMDQPQADYFILIAEQMPEGSKIILCGAEPGWLYANTNRRSFQIVDYAASIAERAKNNISVPILLSGDTHHYSRYASPQGVQFITAGGGGAFLHPTHQLNDEIKLRWLNKRTTLSLKTDPGNGQPTENPACYPSRETSRKLLWRNLWFPVTNWDFALQMGIIYWLVGIGLTLRWQWDAYIIVFAIFAGTLTAYTRYQEKADRPALYISGILSGLAHALAVIALTHWAATLNAGYFMSGKWYEVWLWLGALLVEIGLPGALIGAFIFGLNLLVTCRWFKMNSNDAFSALRLNTYRHFLRIRIEGSQVTIFPIGIDQTPSRRDWEPNPDASADSPNQPVFRPKQPLDPHLIEKPIVVRA